MTQFTYFITNYYGPLDYINTFKSDLIDIFKNLRFLEDKNKSELIDSIVLIHSKDKNLKISLCILYEYFNEPDNSHDSSKNQVGCFVTLSHKNNEIKDTFLGSIEDILKEYYPALRYEKYQSTNYYRES